MESEPVRGHSDRYGGIGHGTRSSVPYVGGGSPHHGYIDSPLFGFNARVLR
jgi:hypothetical protein